MVVVVRRLWEGVKFIGGDPWRTPCGELIWDPPLNLPLVQQRTTNLPHIWDIWAAMVAPLSSADGTSSHCSNTC